MENLCVTANQMTLAACAISMGFGLLLASHPQSRTLSLLLPGLLFVRMALNAMDGMLAREYGQKSEIGAYLNELGDVVSDAFLYLPFALLPEYTSRWMVAVIVLAVISEMAGTVAVMAGASRRYDGPMGKSDRAFVFGALAFWRGLGWRIAPWTAYLFPRLMAVLLVITVINRVRNGLLERNAGGMHG
jgi:CDP-diacylglycerol--glycerol-3-phosphate 3-phosphatidyltransferase